VAASKAAKPAEIAAQRSKQLGLSVEVQAALGDIQAELADAYREGFTEMVRAVQEQASALSRIQNTLGLLLQAVAPTLADQAPPVVRIAAEGESSDIATAIVIADPIAQGFTLSMTTLSKAMGVSAGDLGILVKALKLHEKQGLAVVCREGKHNRVVNFHPRAIEAFKAVIRDTPLSSLSGNDASGLRRLKEKLDAQPPAPRVSANAE
jgi:hypothetical protein